MEPGQTLETTIQHLWIEANREWLQEHNLYKPPPRTKEEADIMLRFLINSCRQIQKQLPLMKAALPLGACIAEDLEDE